MKISLTGIILLAISVCSCAPRHTSDPASVLLTDVGIDIEKVKRVIVIPANGCGGCISKSIEFATATRSSDIAFILSGRSAREIRMVFNGNAAQIKLDTLGRCMKLDLVGEFPVMHTLNNATIVESKQLDGTNIDSVYQAIKTSP